MARIKAVEIPGVDRDALDQGGRVQLGVGAIAAHRPEILAGFGAVTDALLNGGTLSRRLLELVRLRIAFHNQCRSCMAIRYETAVQEGVTEDLVCSLERPAEGEGLTDGERAALRYADLFATNHLAIDDAVYDGLRLHFTEGELVELGMACALYVGFGRLTATWDVSDDLPDEYRRPYDEQASPWRSAAPLVVP